MLFYAATATTIAISVSNYAPDYDPVYERAPYQRPIYSRELMEGGDARRWMTGRFPPPVEVALASLPLPELEPPCELPRLSSRLIARTRERRPLRGRSGRPHARTLQPNTVALAGSVSTLIPKEGSTHETVLVRCPRSRGPGHRAERPR